MIDEDNGESWIEKADLLSINRKEEYIRALRMPYKSAEYNGYVDIVDGFILGMFLTQMSRDVAIADSNKVSLNVYEYLLDEEEWDDCDIYITWEDMFAMEEIPLIDELEIGCIVGDAMNKMRGL